MDNVDIKNKVSSIIASRFRGSYGAGDCADEILSLLAPVLADAEKWRKVMEVYHAETEERFVQFANTISKVRELEGEGEKG